MDLLYKSKKAHYISQLHIAVNTAMGALQNIRNSPGASIDQQIKAIELCIQHFPNIKRALLYIKNTENPIPTGDGNGPSNNST